MSESYTVTETTLDDPEKLAQALADKVGVAKGIGAGAWTKWSFTDGAHVGLYLGDSPSHYTVQYEHDEVVGPLATFKIANGSVNKILDGTVLAGGALATWTQNKFRQGAADALIALQAKAPSVPVATLKKAIPEKMKGMQNLWDAAKVFDEAVASGKLVTTSTQGQGGGWVPTPETPSILPLDPLKLASGSAVKGGGPTAEDMDMKVYDEHEMEHEPTVKLAQATGMYQPVQGTGGGTRYFAIMLHADFKIAVRFKENGGLSIRGEGTLLNSEEGRHSLYHFGFDKVGSDYCSMHPSFGQPNMDGTRVMTRKLIGSIFLGLGLQWESPVPDISIIEGKGN